MYKNILAIGITLLVILSPIVQMTVGLDIDTSKGEFIDDNYNCDKYMYHLLYATYSTDNIPTFFEYQNNNKSINQKSKESEVSIPIEQIQILDGSMDSPWPMYCHDIRHTGRSPYSTSDNAFYNKWWYKCDNYIEGSAVIDKDRVIYFASAESNQRYLFALNPNGSLKWKFEIGGNVKSSPAIDENGVIYFGTVYNVASGDRLYALYPNGTLKWTYFVGDDIFSSPAIADDGTIYFGDANNNINALYPNGTLRWRYKTGDKVYSSPAIDDDGTVYCGSHDTYLYALYPNNGTVKWKYKLEDWVRTSPCIGDDGTIYVTSLALHALYHNGTLKWKTNLGGSTSPTLGQDGTVYCGLFDLYALNPDDGSVKWKFDPGLGRTIQDGTPCNSAEGNIYFGTHIGDFSGGEIISLNPDGTEKWRRLIATEWVDFAPVISEDGTVFIGSSCKEEAYPGAFDNVGYLYAFNEIDPDAPSTPKITGPTRVKSKTEIDYTFKSTSPLGNDVYYYIDWGDGDWRRDIWVGPYKSGENAVISHTWSEPGTYTIGSRCKDTENLWSDWSEFKVTIPRNRAFIGSNCLRFLEHFPYIFSIFRHLSVLQ